MTTFLPCMVERSTSCFYAKQYIKVVFASSTCVLRLGRFGSLNAQEGNASIREISYSSEGLTVQTTLWLLWASHTNEATGRERGHCICQCDWAQMSRKNGFLLHGQGKEDYAWDLGNLLGHPLVLLCPIVLVSGKLWQLSDWTNKDSDPIEMKRVR